MQGPETKTPFATSPNSPFHVALVPRGSQVKLLLFRDKRRRKFESEVLSRSGRIKVQEQNMPLPGPFPITKNLATVARHVGGLMWGPAWPQLRQMAKCEAGFAIIASIDIRVLLQHV